MTRARWIDGVWYEYMEGGVLRRYPPWQKPFRGTQLNLAHPLARGLVRCFVLNEFGGGKVNCAVHPESPGTIYGSPTWTGGLDFERDSGNQIVRAPNDFTKNLTYTTVLVGLRLESVNASDQQTIVSQWSTTAGYRQFILNVEQNGLNLELDLSDDKAYSAGELVVGQYHNIGFTFDDPANTHVFYIDGVTSGSGSTSRTCETCDADLAFGARWSGSSSSQFFDGVIHYVYIYDRILTAEEVALVNREPYCMFR